MTFNNFTSSTMIRKFLKNIINLTINVVHSLLTFKNINKNSRVKKFNANRFKKSLNHSRSKIRNRLILLIILFVNKKFFV